MALPKRCVNNEIAMKQIYIRFLDKHEQVNFHGEKKDPTENEDDKKRYNRNGLSVRNAVGPGAVIPVFRTWNTEEVTTTSRPQTFTSRRRSFSRMNLDSEPKKNLCHSRSRITCSKSNSVPRASLTPCSGCASRIGNSPFRHFTSQPGNVDHPSRINGQLLQDCPD
ncbi:uncharacterized protein LOC120416242 [Culex pipiens pallens]|uniref:uncharacterized protein LOC120416242 n=1 Tax=Culex pipiens pallens TaxID=42434 RepID=UPI0019537DF1|nr:uncharacterized protein LOC120416242 [Culex pipiens pallens]